MANDDATDHFAAFCVFFAPVAFLHVLAIWLQKPWFARLRFASIIPFAVAGALTTKLFNPIQVMWWASDVNGPLRAIFGLASVAQVFAASWTVVVWFILIVLKKRAEGTRTEAQVLGRKRSTAYFYLLLVDLAIVACLLASIAVGSASFPWTIAGCDNKEYAESRMTLGVMRAARDSDRFAACRRGVIIQIMSLISVVLIGLQNIRMFPLINLPTALRFAIFFAIRLLRKPGLKRKDLEQGGATSEKTQSIEEEVTKLVEKHPHYSDLLTVFETSKGAAASEHIEVMAEKCCWGQKSQCWACDGVICDSCKVMRSSIPLPRTTDHIAGCYAICTSCYLVKGTSQPAKFSATLNPTDLSKQHHGCSKMQPKVVNKEVALCLACSRRSPQENSADREDREVCMLARTLMRRILCSKCEKPIPKEKRRWWICGAGDHECHWSGHEVPR
ncbi:hypothetical protein QBC34DRAFT_415018 [Podospora aff. communis PSN243]|uniref:Uncharacterized protein n=1 Tax=Podospora aff. communis PSN243 TaxID=3040156 RepID=A0AAV9GBE7_9PEZI|nr:hypothetical protein QBC34DRAFT_415018 [Podospora aff. communis PSN243]